MTGYQTYQKLHYPSSMFADQSEFSSHIVEKIFEARESPNVMDRDLLYTGVDCQWLEHAVNTMERRRLRCFKANNVDTKTLKIKAMKSVLHSSDQTWFNMTRSRWERLGLLTPNEADELSRSPSGTVYRFPDGPYVDTQKSPDVGIRLASSILPGVVIESGWSECTEDLQNDMQEWLVGGNGRVRAVIILKWSRIQARYAGGIAELYTLDRSGMPHLAQTEQIFPAPPAAVAAAQAIRLTRQTFFGYIPPGRNPLDVLDLTLHDLRRAALPEMALMHLLPAQN